ncbi:MAG: D-aminoacylase, partial [Acidobacteriota bacterium]
MIKGLVFALTLLLGTIFVPGQSASGSILIRGGSLIDGTGRPARIADLRIRGHRIVAIGELRPRRGEVVIEARGKVVAPGFIDIHNHSERGFSNDPDARSQVRQGITTIAVGPDGGSPWPIGEYLQWARQK